jgi:diguanylate cyclase (GGDEF)-like protein
VLQGFDKERALKKAEEIRSRMKQTVYLANHGHQVSLSASFGIATFPDDAGDVSGLLALADRAMFDVKEKGKDAIKTAQGSRSMLHGEPEKMR